MFYFSFFFLTLKDKVYDDDPVKMHQIAPRFIVSETVLFD